MIDFTYDILPGRVLFGVRSRDQVSALTRDRPRRPFEMSPSDL
jgi:hypothetical protein